MLKQHDCTKLVETAIDVYKQGNPKKYEELIAVAKTLCGDEVVNNALEELKSVKENNESKETNDSNKLEAVRQWHLDEVYLIHQMELNSLQMREQILRMECKLIIEKCRHISIAESTILDVKAIIQLLHIAHGKEDLNDKEVVLGQAESLYDVFIANLPEEYFKKESLEASPTETPVRSHNPRRVTTCNGTEQDAKDCISKALKFHESGDLEKAKKWLLKSERMHPTDKAKKLLREIEENPKPNTVNTLHSLKETVRSAYLSKNFKSCEMMLFYINECYPRVDIDKYFSELRRERLTKSHLKSYNDVDHRESPFWFGASTSTENKSWGNKEKFYEPIIENNKPNREIRNLCVDIFKHALATSEFEKAKQSLSNIQRENPTSDVSLSLLLIEIARDNRDSNNCDRSNKVLNGDVWDRKNNVKTIASLKQRIPQEKHANAAMKMKKSNLCDLSRNKNQEPNNTQPILLGNDKFGEPSTSQSENALNNNSTIETIPANHQDLYISEKTASSASELGKNAEVPHIEDSAKHEDPNSTSTNNLDKKELSHKYIKRAQEFCDKKDFDNAKEMLLEAQRAFPSQLISKLLEIVRVKIEESSKHNVVTRKNNVRTHTEESQKRCEKTNDNAQKHVKQTESATDVREKPNQTEDTPAQIHDLDKSSNFDDVSKLTPAIVDSNTNPILQAIVSKLIKTALKYKEANNFNAAKMFAETANSLNPDNITKDLLDNIHVPLHGKKSKKRKHFDHKLKNDRMSLALEIVKYSENVIQKGDAKSARVYLSAAERLYSNKKSQQILKNISTPRNNPLRRV